MNRKALNKLAENARKPDALLSTVAYLSENLSFLKTGEKVLILFNRNGKDRVGKLFGDAVAQRGAEPIFWEEDCRWISLLRLAFSQRITTIIGPPLIVLGLSKLAKYRSVPLNVRNVVTAGYPCMDWMIDGIQNGFDCNTWGCFDPGGTTVICGFSCGKSRGVHLRDSEYEIKILDADGIEQPEGVSGQIVIESKNLKNVQYFHGHSGSVLREQCACGNPSPRLMDFDIMVEEENKDAEALFQFLHSWTSILDCDVKRGPYGIELELVIFPGEKLPKLPTCAKQVIRPWEPETDKPFYYTPDMPEPLF